MCKDNKDLVSEHEIDGTLSDADGLIEGAIELFERAHYSVPTHDSETAQTTITKPTPPEFRSVRKLKRARPDYQSGPVKVYTEEEVRDYELRHQTPD